MKLHSPGFERKLRRGVKRAARASRELKHQARADRWRKHYHLNSLLRPALSAGFAFIVWYVTARTRHVITGLAVLNLWAMAWVFVRAQNLRTNLYAAADLAALSVLPLPEPAVFRWEFWKFLRASRPSLLDLAAGLFAVTLFAGLPVPYWFALIPIAIVSWLTMITLSVLCIARLPRLPYPLICTAFVLAAFAIFFARSLIGEAVIAGLDRFAPTANWLLPTGWPVSLFLILPPGDLWASLGLLLPIGVLYGSLPNSLAILRKNYRFSELLLPEGEDLLPNEDREPPKPSTVAEPSTEAPRRVGRTAIEEIVCSRRFLAQPGWPQNGWLERRLWDWFTPRERALAEFVFPNGLNISAAWRKAARNFLVVAAAAWVAGLADNVLQNWILGPGLFVVACQILAVTYASGDAFRPIFCSGVRIPICAAYAIGYRELGRLLWKCSFVQFPLLIGFLLPCGAVVAALLRFPFVNGMIIGFKAAFLVLSARFILIALAFSSGTNDSTRLRARNLLPLAVILGCALLFLALGATGLLVPDPIVPWALWLFALLDAYAFYRIYGWFYDGNRFDLMSLPRQ